MTWKKYWLQPDFWNDIDEKRPVSDPGKIKTRSKQRSRIKSDPLVTWRGSRPRGRKTGNKELTKSKVQAEKRFYLSGFWDGEQRSSAGAHLSDCSANSSHQEGEGCRPTGFPSYLPSCLTGRNTSRLKLCWCLSSELRHMFLLLSDHVVYSQFKPEDPLGGSTGSTGRIRVFALQLLCRCSSILASELRMLLL